MKLVWLVLIGLIVSTTARGDGRGHSTAGHGGEKAAPGAFADPSVSPPTVTPLGAADPLDPSGVSVDVAPKAGAPT
jgi:hypothetical protein